MVREVFFMRASHKILILLSAAAFALAVPVRAQDEQPSLGDAARQARQQKQQKDGKTDKNATSDAPTKDAPAKDVTAKDATAKDAPTPKTPHVITNDEIPSHVGSTVTNGRGQAQNTNYPQPDYGNGKVPAEQWKSQIQSMKNAIASMQSQMNSVTASIQYAGGNCVSGCAQWNERQRQKLDQVEGMKAQLEQMQKRLEDLQDAARQQGYGSSVYDP
jgi:hypothetical protein